MKLYLFLTAVVAAVAGIPDSQKNARSGLTIGPRFHVETSYGDTGLKTRSVTWGKKGLPLYKQYRGKQRVRLPSAAPIEARFDGTLQARKSVRRYADEPVSLTHLASVLQAAAGLTVERDGVMRRTFPSGGALYPTDLYVGVSRAEATEPGLYYFDPHDSTLVMLASGDPRAQLHAAANEQSAVAEAPVTLILASRFDRITSKYGDRGYRYAYIEIGAICQNVYLAATALGLGTVAVGAFNDDRANALFGFDGDREAVQLLMPVGVPVGE